MRVNCATLNRRSKKSLQTVNPLIKGHYTTFCWIDNQNRKNSHSGWVEYNDSDVKQASEKEVLSSQAYMLLYVDRDLANEI